MKKILLMVCLLMTMTAYTQHRINVAVLPVFDPNEKVDDAYELMIRTYLIAALSETIEYTAIDYETIDENIDIVAYGETGYIKEAERSKLGKMYGAKYLLRAAVDAVEGRIIISVSLWEVETGVIIKTKLEKPEKNLTSLEFACKRLTEKLFPGTNPQEADTFTDSRDGKTNEETNTLIDPRDNKVYRTVKIGNQIWMAENLNFGQMVTRYQKQSKNQAIEKFCYDDNRSNCNIFGGLYTWDEMMQYTKNEGSRGICPVGWHIPSKSDWDMLLTYLEGTPPVRQQGALVYFTAGGQLKESGYGHWSSPNSGATNSSGFSALGCGAHTSEGDEPFMNIMEHTIFWSSTRAVEGISVYCLSYDANYAFENVIPNRMYYAVAFPVRCLKDNY